MLRALYTAGMGMLTQMRQINVVGNNISNINTSGYKKDRPASASFADMMIMRINDDTDHYGSSTVGPLNTGIHMDRVVTVHEQGPLKDTGRSLDLAIYGSGFFTVETENGLRYTRGGSFFLDNEGYIVTGDGHRLIGRDGPVHTGTDDFFIDAYGNIFVNDAYSDSLQMAEFSDLSLLEKEGSLLYNNTGNADNLTSFAGKVIQGCLEESNIDITKELTDMMAGMRSYDTNQRIIRILDDTLEKTVNEIGRL